MTHACDHEPHLYCSAAGCWQRWKDRTVQSNVYPGIGFPPCDRGHAQGNCDCRVEKYERHKSRHKSRQDAPGRFNVDEVWE